MYVRVLPARAPADPELMAELADELFALCDMVHNVPAWLETEPSHGTPLELLLRYAADDPHSVRWLRGELSCLGRQDAVECLDGLVETRRSSSPPSTAEGRAQDLLT
jgi:hypothetical protein